ncbi:unnamed protein product [Sympodiomycopsis kandeliae]
MAPHSDDEAVPSFDDASKEASYWRVKAHDLQDMLREAEESLKDFAESSKELEQEMERELTISSKNLSEMKVKNEKLIQDKDEWKVKYQNSLLEHNKTLAETSRELNQLRESHNIYKSKLRDMELDNDELENAERMVRSSLHDIESRYNQQMEKQVLMEQEIIEKSKLEEELQRLRDELRDVNEELSVMKDREAAARKTVSQDNASSSQSQSSSSSTAPAARMRTPLVPRASLHSRKPSRPNDGTDSPGSGARRALATSIRNSTSTPTPSSRASMRTPLRSTTVNVNGNGSSVRMMKDLTANMAALRSRINTACAFGSTPESEPSTAADANTSSIPRPSSRLGSSIGRESSPLGSSTSTVHAGSTSTRKFEPRTSIPVATSSTSLSRSIKRPTSRLSMGPTSRSSTSTTSYDHNVSPPHHPSSSSSGRAMTPTMYTIRGSKLDPQSTKTLQSGPRLTSRSNTSTPLDFLNSEPPTQYNTRPSSRSGFTPKDSLSDHSTRRRNGSVSSGSEVTTSPPIVSHPLPSLSGRPRGSTISSQSSKSSSISSGHHTRSGSTSESIKAFRESRIARERERNTTTTTTEATALGPPPVNWKSKSRAGLNAHLARSHLADD